MTVSFVMFVCASARMEQLGFHWTDFFEILHLNIFFKSVKKIQVLLKSDKNNGYEVICTFMIFFTEFFLE